LLPVGALPRRSCTRVRLKEVAPEAEVALVLGCFAGGLRIPDGGTDGMRVVAKAQWEVAGLGG
jgi:hypothetical protein